MQIDLARLLYWVAGVVVTLVGSWVASKIRVYHDNRKSHHEDLKTKVLVPLRDGLLANYLDLVAYRTAAINVQWGRVELRAEALVNELPDRHGSFLVSKDPRRQVENSMDRALLEDARKNHHGELIESWQRFRDAWTNHVKEFETWVSAICERVLRRVALPESVDGQRVNQPYVQHLRLGCYIYFRLLAIPTDPLRIEMRGDLACITGPPGDLAMGPLAQIEALFAVLNNLLGEERDEAERLRQAAEPLQKELTTLLDRLALALASKRLLGRCDLVTFF